MESAFCFSKDLQIVLYGVNVYSEKLCVSLLEAGYKTAAFLDRRYEELNGKYPVPVYGLYNHPFAGMDKDRFCAVIMLQNAMQHEAVAMELLRQGFHKILFAPVKSRLKEETAQALRLQYNVLLTGQFDLLREIPLLREDGLPPETGAAYSIIREEGGFKIVWCPAELLYTNPPRVCKDPALLRYANVPLYSYFPYVSLFEYLRGTGEESRQYLDEYGVNSCKYKNSLTNAEVILQRKRLLEIYRNALNKGMDFFISSAPPAEWNEQFGVFNLLEGQHRSLFLVMEGFRYVPVRISQDDFEAWNRPDSSKCVLESRTGGGGRPHVLHPGFHCVNEDSDRNELLQLESVQKYLGGARTAWRGLLEGKTVLDLSGTYGYYARNALRMRAAKAALYAPEGKESAREIHELEGLRGIQTEDDWSRIAGGAYHCLFVMNADMPPDEKRAWADRCARLCLEECFVTVRDPEELKAWKERFSEARELGAFFDRGRPVRLWVLRK